MIKEFSKILITKKASVKDAMKQLDKSAEKILFVVDAGNILIGSLTDGDIRRWILADGNLTATVEDVCFRGTYFVNTTYDINKVKEDVLKKRIVYVPVVDGRKIIEFIVWDTLFDGKIVRKKNKKLNISVVIMAGGKGTRLDPFTRILPKPLIPIGDKPIIEMIIEGFCEYGIKNFYVTVNHKSRMIKAYFEDNIHDYSVQFVQEDKPLGTAGSLGLLGGELGREIVVTNCDVIIKAELHDVIAQHRKNKFDLTVIGAMRQYKIPYGVCKLDAKGQLHSIIEKPEYDYLVNTGMYVVNTELFAKIPKDTMFHMTDLIDLVKLQGGRIGMYPVSEQSWIDIGEWEEYRKAVEIFQK